MICVWDLLWRANLGTRDGECGAFERLLRIDCSPTVDWLIDELDVTAEESLLDCGAGVGGPAAYGRAGGGRDAAARRTRGRGLPRGPNPVRLPLGAGGRIRAGRWLMPPSTPPGRRACARPPTSSSCSRNCAERVRSLGRIALLAFVARQSVSDEQPEGNHFPSVDRLTQSTMPVSGSTHGEAQPTCGHSAGLDSPRRRGHRRPGRAARHGADGRTPKQADR